MKRTLFRLFVLALCVSMLSIVPASSKYVANTLLYWDYELGETADVVDASNGFDLVYTVPIIVTPGTQTLADADNYDGNNVRPSRSSGVQLVIENAPAGWYAFQVLGGRGGCGNRSGTAGAGEGGMGAAVSGVFYFEGGSIMLRGAKGGANNHMPSGERNSGRGQSVQWGGGRAQTAGGGGGGYSAIFAASTTGGLPAVAAHPSADSVIVAIAGGGGGGGEGKGNGGCSDNSVTTGNGGQGGDGYGGTGAGTGGSGTNASNGTAGTGGGGGGSGGQSNQNISIPVGGNAGLYNYNSDLAGSVCHLQDGNPNGASIWYGDGGGGGGGRNGTNESGGNGGSSTAGGAGGGNGSSAAKFLGGEGKDPSGGGGGGGFYGGGGGGSNSKVGGGGGGGGGSSYLKGNVRGLSELPNAWKAILPSVPASALAGRSSPESSGHQVDGANGYAWIMYVGARFPGPSDTLDDWVA